jgi:hypothetical protein
MKALQWGESEKEKERERENVREAGTDSKHPPFPMDIEPEEGPYARLYEEIIDKGTEALLERFKRYAISRKTAVEALRGRIKILKASFDPKGPASRRIVAVDAGRNGTNLRFAYVPIYGAAAVLIENWVLKEEPLCVSGPPDLWPVETDPKRRENLLHMSLEFYLAKKAALRWKPDFLLLDGGIVLNPRLCPSEDSSLQYEGDFLYAAMNVLDLLETCRELGTVLVGFVKRTQMNHYGRLIKNPGVRDMIFLNPLLELGGYTEPFKVKNRVVEMYRRLAEDLNFNPSLAEIYSSYVKTGSFPYRIETPSFCLNSLSDTVSLVYTMADSEGIPYPIHEADRYTRITRPTSNIHTLVLFSKALDLVRKGEISPEDLDMLLLQYGEDWSLDGKGMGDIP